MLETGLGGLYDCTNIINNPLVSVITSIGYDHMHILGNTLPEIAYQKAGIIKENSNTVIFNQEPDIDNVFIAECKKKNNILHKTYASSDELYECIKQFADIGKIYKKSLDNAINEAMNSDLNTVNFIIGSFYTYGTVMNILKNN